MSDRTPAERIAYLEARLAMAHEALEYISARVRPVRVAWDNREVVGQGASAEIRIGVCFGDLRKVAEAGGIADNALSATAPAVAAFIARVEARGAARELRAMGKALRDDAASCPRDSASYELRELIAARLILRAAELEGA